MEAAICALINVSDAPIVDLLAGRPGMSKRIANGATEIIPPPPGVNTPGVFGIDFDRRLVERFDFEAPLEFLPSDLSWYDTPNDQKESTKLYSRLEISRKRADLGNRDLIRAVGDGRAANGNYQTVSVAVLRWIAAAFRGLVADQQHDAVCPPTAFNVFGPSWDEKSHDKQFELIVTLRTHLMA